MNKFKIYLESLNQKVDFYTKFSNTYNTLGFDFNISIARLFVCIFLLWKLLSRNFDFFGYIPSDVFGAYPVDIYPISTVIKWTGTSIITDIFTMHWIHWFLDRPSPETLRIIQNISIILLIMFAILGRGPKRIFAILSYLFLIYLWGNLILLAQEVDSIAIYFGLLLVLGLSNYKDGPIWKLNSLFYEEKNIDAGRTISMMYLVFVAYYFSSGINKLTDISIIEWFKYDLILTIKKSLIVSNTTSSFIPKVFENLFFLGGWGNFFPPFVYLSHLLVPLVFFKRNTVVSFFVFYAAFHFMTFGVGISFTGYIVVWGCLFHYKEWFSKERVA